MIHLGAHDLFAILVGGALGGVGVVAMTMLSSALLSGRSAKLCAIQLGYRATCPVPMGAAGGAWPA